MPCLVRMSQQALEDGKCIVIGLQSTGEARTADVIAERGEELDEFVSGPKVRRCKTCKLPAGLTGLFQIQMLIFHKTDTDKKISGRRVLWHGNQQSTAGRVPQAADVILPWKVMCQALHAAVHSACAVEIDLHAACKSSPHSAPLIPLPAHTTTVLAAVLQELMLKLVEDHYPLPGDASEPNRGSKRAAENGQKPPGKRRRGAAKAAEARDTPEPAAESSLLQLASSEEKIKVQRSPACPRLIAPGTAWGPTIR